LWDNIGTRRVHGAKKVVTTGINVKANLVGARTFVPGDILDAVCYRLPVDAPSSTLEVRRS